jgi:hypothetical protein
MRFCSASSLRTWLLLAATLLVAVPAVAQVEGDDLEGLLEQVGQEYARAYASPFLEAFGTNQNSGLFQSASIPWGRLTFGVGIKAMATHLNEDDQTFTKVVEDVDLSEFGSEFSGMTGSVIFAGPTIFGDDTTPGTITLLPDSGGPPVALEGIPGLVDTRFVPMLAPEASVGGVFGLRATLRWFPEMDLGNYGKTKYMGLGFQWSPNGLLQNPLPVDIMVGYFNQQLDVGSLIETSAKSMFLAASKDLGTITVYGGFAKEESDMTVTYTYLETGEEVSFKSEGSQGSRITLGAKLAILNLEMSHGDLTTYSAGAMFGF